jgi:hypothetical protein
MSAAVVGCVCLTLRSTLAHLNLAACGLDDDALCLDEPIAALGSSAAGPSSSTGAGSASAGAGSTGLWARLSVLRELSLADNPRVSARSCVAILSRVPSLHALDVGGSDFWPEETPPLLAALTTASSLRWLGCHECGGWLDADALRALSRASLRVAASAETWQRMTLQGRAPVDGWCAGAPLPASVRAAPLAPPLESWEDVTDALDDDGTSAASVDANVAPLPPALRLVPAADGGTAARADGATAHGGAAASARVDYDRPERYRVQPRERTSIYHVSFGGRPLYGEGSLIRTHTDAHGMHS